MFRWLFVSVFLFAAAGGLALGCGSGLSDSESKLRCQEFQNSNPACVTDKAFAQCLSCVEQCGDKCDFEATCPSVFSCDDNTPSE